MEDISAPYFLFFSGKRSLYLRFEHKNSPFYVKSIFKTDPKHNESDNNKNRAVKKRGSFDIDISKYQRRWKNAVSYRHCLRYTHH